VGAGVGAGVGDGAGVGFGVGPGYGGEGDGMGAGGGDGLGAGVGGGTCAGTVSRAAAWSGIIPRLTARPTPSVTSSFATFTIRMGHAPHSALHRWCRRLIGHG
jgi:hypothetical protein